VPIHLVGHSMGGRNALAFAHRHPHRVKKLVIEDIGPDSHPDALKQIEFYLGQVPTPFADKRAAKRFFDEVFPGLIGSGPKARVLAQYFYTNITTREDGLADWRFSPKAILGSVKEGRAYERWDQIRDLKMPTLVIRGGRSEELTEEVFHRMVAANPLIKGVQIEHSGHWVHFDQPQAFIEALTHFFAE
ncbi:MAG: alpha/beta hydrolase, partial [Bdellovibrionales bacterium]|nr:alpha/beta hydrolase [Bdellovibrionales bacterium]